MIKILQNVSIGPLSNLPSRTRRTNRIGPYKVHEDKSFCFSFMCISSKVDLRQADPTVHLLQRVRIGQLFREIGLLFILPSGHTCYETDSITIHSEIEYPVAAAAKLLLA